MAGEHEHAAKWSGAGGRLPDRLRGLEDASVTAVVNDGAVGGGHAVAAVCRVDGVDALVKVSRAPLPGTAAELEALLHGLALAPRAEYSGAEYGYYAAPRLDVDVVCPAVLPDAVMPAEAREKLMQKHVARASAQAFKQLRETPGAYTAAHVPYVAAIPESALGWVYKILAKEKERERLLFDCERRDDGFLLNVDPKWTDHPDVADTPREMWKAHPSTKHLYCLALCHRRDVSSLRSLQGDAHLPLLRRIRDQGYKTIEEVYGVKADDLRVFVHYPPQFYHFHVHFTALGVEGPGVFTERAHLLDDVIDNLERDPEHYTKCNLTVRLGETDKLYKPLSDAVRADA